LRSFISGKSLCYTTQSHVKEITLGYMDRRINRNLHCSPRIKSI